MNLSFLWLSAVRWTDQATHVITCLLYIGALEETSWLLQRTNTSISWTSEASLTFCILTYVIQIVCVYLCSVSNWSIFMLESVMYKLNVSVSSQDLTVMWRLTCLESLPSVGLRPSACGFWTHWPLIRTDLLLRTCWWDGWMAPSAGCRSQCRRMTCMSGALNSPTAIRKSVRTTNILMKNTNTYNCTFHTQIH